MACFRVEIIETLQKIVEIEIPSIVDGVPLDFFEQRDEAIAKVEEDYAEGTIVLGSEDYVDHEIRIHYE